jgi:hypothetical protein
MGNAKRAPEGPAGVLETLHTVIDGSDVEQFEPVVAQDAFVLSPMAEGVLIGRAAVLDDVQARLGRATRSNEIHLLSAEPVIHVSDSGRCAWLWDQLEVGAVPGDPPVAVRLTAVLEATEGSWQLTAAHWSVPIPNDTAKALLKQGRLAPGMALADRLEPGADRLAEALETALGNIASLPGLYSMGSDQVTIGSAREEVILGPAARPAWQEFVGFGPTFARRGGIRGGLTRDASFGWLATHLDITFDLPMPYRFYIWRQRANDWEIMASHDSLSVDPCEMRDVNRPD